MSFTIEKISKCSLLKEHFALLLCYINLTKREQYIIDNSTNSVKLNGFLVRLLLKHANKSGVSKLIIKDFIVNKSYLKRFKYVKPSDDVNNIDKFEWEIYHSLNKNILKDKTELLIMLTIEQIENNNKRKNKIFKLLENEKED